MGRRINSDAIHTGRNADEQAAGQPYPPSSTAGLPPYTISTTGASTWRDDRYVRCARCGFICNLDRDRRSREGSREGWGINYEAVANFDYNETDVGYEDIFTTYDDEDLPSLDPVVIAGCPSCGTLLYDK
jgi:hypothetical protein